MSQPQMSIEFTEVDALSDVKNRIKEIRDIKPAKPKISPFYAMVAKNIAAARRMTAPMNYARLTHLYWIKSCQIIGRH